MLSCVYCSTNFEFAGAAGDGDISLMREIVDERTNGMEINLQELLLAYLHKWWIIAVCLLISASIAIGAAWEFVTPMYQAEVSIYVSNSRGIEGTEYLSSADLSAAQRLVNTYISIVKSDRVLEIMSEKLDGDYSPSELSGAIRATQINETEIFCIYVLHADPVEAARIANVAADIVPVEISNLIEGTSARVIDFAKVPTSRYSPSYSKAGVVGGVVGAIIALIYLTVAHLGDTRIKDENDLTSLINLPVLGRVPNFEIITPTRAYGYYEQKEVKKETVEA